MVSSPSSEENKPSELLSSETSEPVEPKEENKEIAQTIKERIPEGEQAPYGASIERIIPVTQITQQVVSPDNQQLQSIESRIQDLFARNETQAKQSTSIFQALSQSQRINNLSGITITNATVSGVSGLTDSDIPNSITASNYLLLTGGTLTGALTGTSLTLSGDLTVSGSQNFTGLQTFSQASSTRLSVFDQIWIGGAGTTTLRGDGYASTIPFASTTAITVSGTASTSQLVVSSPSATSTFSGNVDVTGNINFNGLFLQDNAPFVGSQWTTSGSDIYYSTGNVGISTTSPYAKLSIVGQTVSAYFTATSSLFSTFPYASTTALTVSGVASTTELIVSGTATSIFGGPLQINIAAGTAPLAVVSTTKVANLNADLLDGFDSSAFGDATAANQTTMLTRIGTNADATTTPSAASSVFSALKFISGPQISCPSGMVYVSSNGGGFCIDKYEASAESATCPNATPGSQTQTLANLDDADCKPVSVSGSTPWAYISQGQAALACAKAGKRLPANAEWYYAALGTPDSASGWGANDCQVNSNWASQPGPTGSGSNCVSTAGAYDMVGNLWEWVDDSIYAGLWRGQSLPAQGYIDGVDGKGLVGETNGTTANANYNEDYFWISAIGARGFVRGGGWNNGAFAGVFALNLSGAPSDVYGNFGFRCVL